MSKSKMQTVARGFDALAEYVLHGVCERYTIALVIVPNRECPSGCALAVDTDCPHEMEVRISESELERYDADIIIGECAHELGHAHDWIHHRLVGSDYEREFYADSYADKLLRWYNGSGFVIVLYAWEQTPGVVTTASDTHPSFGARYHNLVKRFYK